MEMSIEMSAMGIVPFVLAQALIATSIACAEFGKSASAITGA